MGCWAINGSNSRRLEVCLQKCQARFQKWGKGTSTSIRQKVLTYQQILPGLYSKPPPWDFIEIKKVEDQLDKALEDEEIFWKQRSRENWLNWGDKNTRWFHKQASQRKKRNENREIHDQNGVLISDKHQLEQAFISYFFPYFFLI